MLIVPLKEGACQRLLARLLWFRNIDNRLKLFVFVEFILGE